MPLILYRLEGSLAASGGGGRLGRARDSCRRISIFDFAVEGAAREERGERGII